MIDTNTVQLLLQALARNNGASSGSDALIVTMIISAMAPLVASIAAYFMARAAKENTAESKEAARTTSEEVKKIHVAVNSERSVLLEKLAAKDALILEMVKKQADLDVERERERTRKKE